MFLPLIVERANRVRKEVGYTAGALAIAIGHSLESGPKFRLRRLVLRRLVLRRLVLRRLMLR